MQIIVHFHLFSLTSNFKENVHINIWKIFIPKANIGLNIFHREKNYRRYKYFCPSCYYKRIRNSISFPNNNNTTLWLYGTFCLRAQKVNSMQGVKDFFIKINNIPSGENSKVINSIWFLLCGHNTGTEKNLEICGVIFSDP